MKMNHVALVAAALFGTAAAQPVAAMPIAALAAPQSSAIIQVHDGHGHGHWHQGHRFHGYDGYYDDNSDSGVLFKSFVTGSLFNEGRGRAYSDHDAACAARYRSYDPADNSYQPSRGPRRECR